MIIYLLINPKIKLNYTSYILLTRLPSIFVALHTFSKTRKIYNGWTFYRALTAVSCHGI